MDRLVVLDHIPKSAGVAMRQVARANYAPEEFVSLEREAADIAAGRIDPEAAERRTRQFYASLPPERRARLRCLAGYAAPMVIPTVTDRPMRAFCMLRDPVDRVISYYLFQRWRNETLGDSTPMMVAMQERNWQLKDVYRELGGEPTSPLHLPFAPLFNGQARHLLVGQLEWSEIPFRPGEEGLEEYRDRAFALLEDTYVVGTQDHFSESIRLFAESFGWRRAFVPRVNAGRLRGGPREGELDDETCALIRSHNRIDADLHAHYSQLLDGRPRMGRLADLRGRAWRGARRSRSRLSRAGRGTARRIRAVRT